MVGDSGLVYLCLEYTWFWKSLFGADVAQLCAEESHLFSRGIICALLLHPDVAAPHHVPHSFSPLFLAPRISPLFPTWFALFFRWWWKPAKSIRISTIHYAHSPFCPSQFQPLLSLWHSRTSEFVTLWFVEPYLGLCRRDLWLESGCCIERNFTAVTTLGVNDLWTARMFVPLTPHHKEECEIWRSTYRLSVTTGAEHKPGQSQMWNHLLPSFCSIKKVNLWTPFSQRKVQTINWQPGLICRALIPCGGDLFGIYKISLCEVTWCLTPSGRSLED